MLFSICSIRIKSSVFGSLFSDLILVSYFSNKNLLSIDNLVNLVDIVLFPVQSNLVLSVSSCQEDYVIMSRVTVTTQRLRAELDGYQPSLFKRRLHHRIKSKWYFCFRLTTEIAKTSKANQVLGLMKYTLNSWSD